MDFTSEGLLMFIYINLINIKYLVNFFYQASAFSKYINLVLKQTSGGAIT